MASTSSTTTEQQQPSTVLAYPLPPLQYINNIDPNNLPPPPPPITEGVYHMFGQKISLDDAIIAPLEAHGTKRLFPRSEYDHKKELKKINASILVNFIDLIDVLVKCPDTDKRIEKCNDIATLFINFHHLINELRPHQARETLRVWLTAQKKTRDEITKKLNAEMDRMTKVLERYYEWEASNTNAKHSQQQQAIDVKPIGDHANSSISASSGTTNNPSTPTTNNTAATISIDDIMCEIVDQTSKEI